MKVALSSFQEVINRLCHGTQSDGKSQEVIQDIDKVKLLILIIFKTQCKMSHTQASTISIMLYV